MTLSDIARSLREEGTVISAHVVEPTEAAALGAFVVAGPRCRKAPEEYAFVVEVIREGYLLHYGEPRIVAGADSDLALLAGDHLYAIGLERLARLGDLEAVRELADLISLGAQLGGEGREAAALWIASATAVAAGGSDEHEAAKAALRRGEETAAAALRAEARARAEIAGLAEALEEMAEAIESAADVSA